MDEHEGMAWHDGDRVDLPGDYGFLVRFDPIFAATSSSVAVFCFSSRKTMVVLLQVARTTTRKAEKRFAPEYCNVRHFSLFVLTIFRLK
jgi:hypothetical protein